MASGVKGITEGVRRLLGRRGRGWQQILAWLLLPLTVSAIPLLTEGESAFKPFYPALIASTILLVAHLLLPGGKRGMEMVIIVAAALSAGNILLLGGFPRGHDAPHHLWGLWAFFRTFKEGDLYPLWIPYIGLGIPLLLFYPPLNFFLALPFQVAGLAPVEALKGLYLLGSFLSGMSMYLLGKELGAGRKGALIASVFYILAPYRLLDMNLRAALGEVNAFIFLPLPLLFLLKVMKGGAGRGWHDVAWGGISIALLSLTHLLTTFMAGICLAILALYLSILRSRDEGWGPALKGKGLKLLVMATLGFSLSAFFWLPAVLESRHTSIGRYLYSEGVPGYPQHSLGLTQPFERKMWYGWQISKKGGGGEGEMPFYAGVTLLTSSILALILSPSSLTSGLFGVTVFSLGMTISPFTDLAIIIPPFIFLQFPWRFLALFTLFSCALSGIALGRLMEGGGVWKRVLGLLFVVVTVADFAPYTSAPDLIPPYEGLTHFHFRKRRGCDLFYRCSKGIRLKRGEGLFTLRGVKYPPSGYEEEVRIFDRVFSEYLNKDVYKRYYKSKDRDVLEEVGVALLCNQWRGKCREFEPEPYAVALSGDGVRPLDFALIPDGIEIRGSMKKGERVVIKEQYFRGWRGRSGRREVPVSSSGGLVTVEMKEDSECLRLEFGMRTPERMAGLLISAVSLMALFVSAGSKSMRGLRG